jgi:hypothetical protein
MFYLFGILLVIVILALFTVHQLTLAFTDMCQGSFFSAFFGPSSSSWDEKRNKEKANNTKK